MADDAQSINLTNHFLIAMPGMDDGTFARSVVYVCEHSERGALGLIINKPGDISLADLFERVDLPLSRPELGAQPVFQGGPLQTERGFVLHGPAKPYSSTLPISPDVSLTTSKDVLEAVAEGTGPDRMLVTLGYSGWGAGQLESEIAQNAWLTVKARPDIIFDTPADEKYNAALKLLGVDTLRLSGQAGHA